MVSVFMLKHVERLTMVVAMVYTRAAASDYDDWEKIYGNKGWASKDLIPLLNKVCVWIHCVPALS